eukprot:8076360-Pyramimonas_sp.AAC.1
MDRKARVPRTDPGRPPFSPIRWTGIGSDHWHPRWWAWLSDEGKDCLIQLVMFISRTAQFPSQ